MQHLIGVGGVIVDLVQEITTAVSDFKTSSSEEAGEDEGLLGVGEDDGGEKAAKPRFSQRELSFLLKLIPELMQSSSH